MYDPIWAEAERNAKLPVKCRKMIGRVHERLEKLIGHEDCPRLVHWDLWSGNILCRADELGRWWVCALLDPNCKFAHVEAEIAYLELFHTVNGAFMRAYQQGRKLGEGYQRVRKWVYQMYPLIDDVTLHGERYVRPLVEAVERVGRVV
jgi:fructosamine-3-kinase